VGLIILTLLGLKYLPGWVKLVWLFHRTTFADKKGTASVFFISHIVEHWKRSKSATLIVENRKGGYLEMRDNHP